MTTLRRRKPKVLVVDDEDSFLEIMKLQLKSSGFKSASLHSGVPGEVIAYCKKNTPDLVLLDIYFSESPHGFKIAHALKENPATSEIKILFWSAAGREVSYGSFSSEWKGDRNDILDKTENISLVTEKIRGALAYSG
ncbi:MAG: response regulator [Patescibacteria group bacterium]|nr:response regulator [Patescibacteria group bacterium]